MGLSIGPVTPKFPAVENDGGDFRQCAEYSGHDHRNKAKWHKIFLLREIASKSASSPITLKETFGLIRILDEEK